MFHVGTYTIEEERSVRQLGSEPNLRNVMSIVSDSLTLSSHIAVVDLIFSPLLLLNSDRVVMNHNLTTENYWKE